MTCANCGTPLPADALFCGECGRSVAPPVLPPAQVRRRPPTAPLVPPRVPPLLPPRGAASGTVFPDRAQTPDMAKEQSPERDLCEQCGAAMSRTDIFCGECGHVSPPINRGSVAPRRAIQPSEPSDPSETNNGEDDLADSEDTRIVPGRGRGERFSLQFSTGESVTVFGTGLIGRNPLPEPGEHFDQLLRVLDPTRSVSKTHLEFGQEAGEFWVRDRYSGNGSGVREPERASFPCAPGKRYILARGSRVDIGEQFFIVS